jgi:hypothetical protein
MDLVTLFLWLYIVQVDGEVHVHHQKPRTPRNEEQDVTHKPSWGGKNEKRACVNPKRQGTKRRHTRQSGHGLQGWALRTVSKERYVNEGGPSCSHLRPGDRVSGAPNSQRLPPQWHCPCVSFASSPEYTEKKTHLQFSIVLHCPIPFILHTTALHPEHKIPFRPRDNPPCGGRPKSAHPSPLSNPVSQVGNYTHARDENLRTVIRGL